jgi:hypothetical protein
MRRAWAFVGAAGVVFALFGQLDNMPPAAAAGLTVISSVALALLAHGGTSLASEAVALGAGGALAYEAARPYLPLVATGLLLTFVFGTRAMRARSWRELSFHLGAAFVGGMGASWIARAQQGSEMTLWLVAVIVAAILASVPWLVPTDGPRAFALRRLAARAQGPLRFRLLRAVVIARRMAELPAPLPRRVSKRVLHAFDEVIMLAERRLDGRSSALIDGELARTIDHLTRIARAARRRAVLIDGLEGDAALLHTEKDALEAEVAALAELR